VALTSVSSSAQPDISLYSEIMETGLMHRAVCLFTYQVSLLFILPIRRDGQAELTWAAN